MMDRRLTLCVVNYNACDALALLLESYRFYHPEEDTSIFIYDNGSTDGALEYAQKRADLLLKNNKNNIHGWALSRLCEQVRTPYMLVVDNDIEFKTPIVPKMISCLDEENGYCICPPRRRHIDHFGSFGETSYFNIPMESQWAPEICCMVMKTEVVKKILKFIDFGVYIYYPGQEYFETGSLFYRFAIAHGYELLEKPWIWDSIEHYGQISTLWLGLEKIPRYEKEMPIIQNKYKIIQNRLRMLRSKSDLPLSESIRQPLLL